MLVTYKTNYNIITANSRGAEEVGLAVVVLGIVLDILRAGRYLALDKTCHREAHDSDESCTFHRFCWVSCIGSLDTILEVKETLQGRAFIRVRLSNQLRRRMQTYKRHYCDVTALP